MEVNVKTAAQLRLTEEEFELIKHKLGRTPNFNELCAFSGMCLPSLGKVLSHLMEFL